MQTDEHRLYHPSTDSPRSDITSLASAPNDAPVEQGSSTPVSDLSPYSQELLFCLQDLLNRGTELVSDLMSSHSGNAKQFTESHIATLANLLLQMESILWTYSNNSGNSRDDILRLLVRNYTTPTPSVECKISSTLVMFRMPHLPPKKNKNNTLAVDQLAAAIFSESAFPKWKSCHLVFTHVFPSNVRTLPKDVENYEYKKAIDLICYALGLSDGATTFSVEMRTLFTDELLPGTYAFAFPNLPKMFEISLWNNFQKPEN